MLTSLLLTLVIVGVFPPLAGYIVLLERKVLADMQSRLGPMRVGPHGLLQPLADALKMMLKEDVVPSAADYALFWVAPMVSLFTALTAFAVLPFSAHVYVTDVNVGLLVVAAMGGMSVLGLILGGWSSNSHYPLLGALRSAAQLVSYEVALSLALLAGVMAAGSLSLVEIVRTQEARGIWLAFDNWGLMLIPFFVYFVAGVAETNRAPFDLPEAESELVAGYQTEYSGLRWGFYTIAEYANLFVVASVGVALFWGGWLRPFPSVGWLAWPLNTGFPLLLFAAGGVGCLRLLPTVPTRPQRLMLTAVGGLLLVAGLLFLVPAVNAAISGLFWFFYKLALMIYALIWMRGTFPRFRYDQLMNLGWKYLIPLALVAVLVNALAGLIA